MSLLDVWAARPLVHGTFGGGLNSTALYMELVRIGPRPEAITFSDTGGERPETYKHVDEFSAWLVAQGFPPILKVRRARRDKRVLSLEEECVEKKMLPSIAYGYKTCSQKYKIEAQDKWCNNHPPYRAEWKAGRVVTKLIGYDWDEPFRARIGHDKKYQYSYPLIDWRWRRADCDRVVRERWGRSVAKSSCFFCPSMKKPEIAALREEHPDLYARALRMERNAELRKIKGLGRRFSWEDMIGPEVENETPCGCYDG